MTLSIITFWRQSTLEERRRLAGAGEASLLTILTRPPPVRSPSHPRHDMIFLHHIHSVNNFGRDTHKREVMGNQYILIEFW